MKDRSIIYYLPQERQLAILVFRSIAGEGEGCAQGIGGRSRWRCRRRGGEGKTRPGAQGAAGGPWERGLVGYG